MCEYLIKSLINLNIVILNQFPIRTIVVVHEFVQGEFFSNKISFFHLVYIMGLQSICFKNKIIIQYLPSEIPVGFITFVTNN